MSDPARRAPLDPERLKRIAAGVRVKSGQSAERSARIGSYLAPDGTDHEVVIVNTAPENWEVRDRGAEGEETIEQFGTAQESSLEDAVALAVEYRRDHEQQGIHARAQLAARDTLRRRAAIAETALGHAALGRRAA
jgi:hypothetical protein